jgi:hypothetical protein
MANKPETTILSAQVPTALLDELVRMADVNDSQRECGDPLGASGVCQFPSSSGDARGTWRSARRALRAVEAMSTQLVAEILRAHGAVERGEPGADERLKQLQHQYRPAVRSSGRVAVPPSSSMAPQPRQVRDE